MKVLIAIAAAVVSLCGCGLAPPAVTPAELQRLRGIHAQVCPNDEPVLETIANDASDSVAESLWEVRRVAIEAELETIAICGGTVKVWEFGSSSAATNTLFEGELRPDGAELNARLLKVPGLVGAAMAQIEQAHAVGAVTLDSDGTDISGQFVNAAAYFESDTDAAIRRAVFLTDGWSAALPATAPELGRDVQVWIAGVGVFDTSKRSPDEAKIAQARQRLDAYCALTQARCHPATSDYNPTT